MTSRILRAVDW